MKIAVTGRNGQLARAMRERAPRGATLISLGRPELDLSDLDAIAQAVRSARPDILVNAAAYTAVDQAESEPALAYRVNGAAAGELAKIATDLKIPVIQISTDYVFDGTLNRPYQENDATGPVSVYGFSKLQGERAVAAETSNHVILRTSWVYAPFGSNFVRTMLRLADSRDEIGVVADQQGNPTSALDLADAIFVIAQNLLNSEIDGSLRGTFHLSAGGEAVWADVAESVFAVRKDMGFRSVAVKRLSTVDYPTPARRPANSRLDCAKIAEHGIKLPYWRDSLEICVKRLLESGNLK